MIHYLAALTASILVSLLSLVGVLFLSLKEKILNQILLYLVAFSAGSLLGAAFLHLLPEAIESQKQNFGIAILAGFILFFIIEKFLHWHHCHKNQNCHHIKTLSYMNLVGDAVHNFIDGLLIAASFSVSFNLGFITTINLIFHEIPQEIGDFGVLIHGGFKKSKALLFNLISASTALLGTIIGLLISSKNETISAFLIPLAAGGFIYIAATDLIPELKESQKPIPIFFSFLAGILLMLVLKD